MNRNVLLTTSLVFLLSGGMVRAADFAQVIVTELQEQGYTRIATEKTWLGRVRIMAERPNGTREIIVNPRTGEILRDLWILADGTSGRTAESNIVSRGYDDDDPDDDSGFDDSGSDDSDDSGSDDSDDPDSDDSDNSGSGSDSSGSGSGGSDSDGSDDD